MVVERCCLPQRQAGRQAGTTHTLHELSPPLEITSFPDPFPTPNYYRIRQPLRTMVIGEGREVSEGRPLSLHLQPIGSRFPPPTTPSAAAMSSSTTSTAAATAAAADTAGHSVAGAAAAAVERSGVRSPQGRQAHRGEGEHREQGQQPRDPRHYLAASWEAVQAHPQRRRDERGLDGGRSKGGGRGLRSMGRLVDGISHAHSRRALEKETCACCL